MDGYRTILFFFPIYNLLKSLAILYNSDIIIIRHTAHCGFFTQAGNIKLVMWLFF